MLASWKSPARLVDLPLGVGSGGADRVLLRVGHYKLEWSIEIPSFLDLGVSAPLVSRLNQLGITEPLPVQSATIQDALAGRDVCAMAPTGSGKTLAFGLPILERMSKSKPLHPKFLVLVPTRELAAQVCEVMGNLTGGGHGRVIAVYGGTGYTTQRKVLNRGVDVVVACPGRLEDLVSRGDIELSQISFVVVDEADRMADMGFLPAVRRILDKTSRDRQVLLYSATMGSDVENLVSGYQTNPVRHRIAADEENVGDVEHLFWQTEKAERVNLTARLVEEHGRTVVFCRTKRGADRVVRQLQSVGVEAVAIHGDRTQGQRERALSSFASGKIDALVATDVVARGIHVDGLACVVHFDPAQDVTDYVHRSGRTGRAGNAGTVVSLVGDEHKAATRSIQKSLGFKSGLELPRTGSPNRSAAAKPTRPASEIARLGATTSSSSIMFNTSTKESKQHSTNNNKTSKQHRSEKLLDSTKQSKNSKIKRERRKRITMPTGTVKFFNGEKGYGFISRPDGNDVFVHYSNVEGSGFRTLEEGQQVEFELAPGRKGEEARNVRVV